MRTCRSALGGDLRAQRGRDLDALLPVASLVSDRLTAPAS
jgi:hypothetical protein